jgi:sugar phosphate isomerase/epimerase
MRFGIQPFEFSSIVGMISEGGSFDISRLSISQIVKRCIEKGFRVIELGLDLGYVLPGSITKKAVDELVKIKQAERITYTVHLPLWAIEPASPNEFIRKASVQALADAVRLCEPIKPEAYVIHATGALAAEFSRLEIPALYKDYISNSMTNTAEKSIKELQQLTNLNPKKIAVETVEFPFKFMRKMVDENDLSICFDTGHLLAGYPGNYTVTEFLEENIDKIVDIHLHDGFHEDKGKGIKIVRDHLPLGKGKLPLVEFFRFLEDNNYSSPLIFELTMAEATESLQVIRKLFPSALGNP